MVEVFLSTHIYVGYKLASSSLYIFPCDRTLQTIEWSTRPKWVTEERLYGLACADLTPTKKTFFLRAMASSDPSNIKSISFPQTCTSNAFHVHHYITSMFFDLIRFALPFYSGSLFL